MGRGELCSVGRAPALELSCLALPVSSSEPPGKALNLSFLIASPLRTDSAWEGP